MYVNCVNKQAARDRDFRVRGLRAVTCVFVVCVFVICVFVVCVS